MEYNEITNEQWEIYRAVDRACLKEDLKFVLQNDYERDITEFSDKDIEYTLDRFNDYISDSEEWRQYMHFAIEKELDL